MGLKRYRATDLTLLAVIMCVLEAGLILIVNNKIPAYTVTMTVLVSLLVLVRWNGYAAIHLIVGGLLYSAMIIYFYGSADFNAFLQMAFVYVGGNLFLLFDLLLLKFIGKEKIRSNALLIILYVVTGYLLVFLGRALFERILGNSFISSFLMYVKYDALSCVLAIIVMIITSKQNRVFADQKEYYYDVRGGNE